MSELNPEFDLLHQKAEELSRQGVEAVKLELRNAIRDDRRKRFDLDVRGLLAIFALLGAFSLAFVQLATGVSAEIPAWAAAVVSGVTGFYFGSRGGAEAKGGDS